MRTVRFQHEGLFGAVIDRIERSRGVQLEANGVDAFVRAFALREIVQPVEDIVLLEVELMTSSAPPALAMERRSGSRSITITFLAPSRTALRMQNCPTGPAPQIATISVGWMSH